MYDWYVAVFKDDDTYVSMREFADKNDAEHFASLINRRESRYFAKVVSAEEVDERGYIN